MEKKFRLLFLLALLMTAATGAWAQEPATTYSVKMKDGTQDAKNWSIASGEKSAKGDAADGLTGLKEKDAVTLTYNGRLKVKGVKAVSDAAAAAVPDGALNGKFSVSDGKQVYFSKGNLRYASSKWSFFDNQYDYYTSYSADAWDKFGWSTSATTYGMNTSKANDDYSGDFVDWGATMGTGWFTLSSDEWTYLFNTRSASTVGGTENGRYAKAKVNDVQGVILFPDTYTHPDGVTAPTGVNATGDTGWNGNNYSSADWTKMESAGCVFLPAAGCRYGSEMIGLGSDGYYGSATPDGADYAYRVKFNSGSLEPANSINRCLGCSVRLVQEVATSDEKPAAPASTTLDNTITAWTAGTYAVPAGGLTYSDAITVSGDVTLVLTDGETLTLNNGISLASGATLTIEGNGTMNVNGTNNSTASTVAGSTGTLILTSGTLTATGGKGQDMTDDNETGASGGAAINGSVTVNGGSLTAKGGNGGNCIGEAPASTNGGAGGAAISGDVTITDGAVAATGGNGGRIGATDDAGSYDVHGGAGGAAIGGNATLTGGTLTTTQGANGTQTGYFEESSVGAGGKAVAGTVTDNR